MIEPSAKALVSERPNYRLFARVYKKGNNAWKLETEHGHDFAVDMSDFDVTGNYISVEASGDKIFGNAVAKTAHLIIKNPRSHTVKDFTDACLLLYVYAYGKATERFAINLGFNYYFVTAVTLQDGKIVIDASDIMLKADKEYVSTYDFPTNPIIDTWPTLKEIYNDVREQMGLPIDPVYTPFANCHAGVPINPKGYTCRQILGFIAELAGSNAMAVAGRPLIEIRALSTSSPYNELEQWINITTQFENAKYTGMYCYENYDFYGNELPSAQYYTTSQFSSENAIELNNPLAYGTEFDWINDIYGLVKNFPIGKFSGTYIGYPLAEFGDYAEIIIGSRLITTFLTRIVWNISGSTEFACDVASGQENSATYSEKVPESNLNTTAAVVVEEGSDSLSSYTDRDGATVSAFATRRWRKWSSGLLEQWIQLEVNNVPFETASGVLYRSTTIKFPPYKIPFNSINMAIPDYNRTVNYVAWMAKTSEDGTTYPPNVAGMRYNNSGNMTGTVSIYAVGDWR